MTIEREARRRALKLGSAVAGIAVITTLLIVSELGQAQVRLSTDVANVSALLVAMRGTAPIPCALALTVIEGNAGWGNRYGGESGMSDPVLGQLRPWLEQRITDPAVVPVLRSAMVPGDACVRQTAARLLGRTRHPQAVRALVEALRDADPSTRELGALGLGLADDASVHEPLVGALRDTGAGVRAASAMALGQLEDHRAAPALVALLRNVRVPEVRRAAASAL